jgi:hypothetical protein
MWRNIVTEHEESAAAAAVAKGGGSNAADDEDEIHQRTKAEEDQEGLAGGCILAHSMGLGKSVQVITLLHTMMMRDRYGGGEQEVLHA